LREVERRPDDQATPWSTGKSADTAYARAFVSDAQNVRLQVYGSSGPAVPIISC